MNTQKVIGIFLRRPPIQRMSCSWCRAWMIAPEPRKSRALKKAWVTTWKKPAVKAPMPTPMNM